MAMFENLGHFFKRMVKTEQQKELGSKDAAKERLHLVLMQDRANVSADFLELMKQEIIDVIKKYIVVDEESIDVRLTNQSNNDGTNGAPSLYANIPIVNIKNDMMAEKIKDFEGVDFNKDMGIPSYTQKMEENKVETPQVIELPQNNIQQEENIQEENLSSNNKDSKEEEKEEVKEMFEEVDDIDDDDDDDVTFDDLLKAAEAADRASAEEEELKNNEKNKSKNSSKTKDKRKKKNQE